MPNNPANPYSVQIMPITRIVPMSYPPFYPMIYFFKSISYWFTGGKET